MDNRYVGNLLTHIMNDGTVYLLPSILPLVVIEYGFSYITAGYVSAIIPLCLGVLQTPIGRYADRVSSALLLRIGILIVGAGSLVAGLAPSLFLPALFIIGVGGSFYHPVGYAYTSRIMSSGKTGLALGMQSSSGDIGILFAFLTAGPMALIAGWRSVFVVWGIASILIALATTLLFKGDDSAPASSLSDLSALKTRQAILVMVLFMILGAVQKLIHTYLPTIFFMQGTGITLADLMTSLLIGTGIIGGIIGGRLTDRRGARLVTIAFNAAAAIALSLMFFSSQLAFSASMIVALGLALMGLYPPLYYVMRQVTKGKLVGTAYGLLLSLSMFSGILGVTAGGYIVEYMPSMVYLLGAALCIVAAALALGLPRRNE